MQTLTHSAFDTTLDLPKGLKNMTNTTIADQETRWKNKQTNKLVFWFNKLRLCLSQSFSIEMFTFLKKLKLRTITRNKKVVVSHFKGNHSITAIKIKSNHDTYSSAAVLILHNSSTWLRSSSRSHSKFLLQRSTRTV